MAAKKYYLVTRFETEEDYKKYFNRIYNSGYDHGFKDGRINALSYFTDTICEKFSDMESKSAAYEMGERHKAEFNKELEDRKNQERYLREKIEKEMLEKSKNLEEL